MNRVRPFTSWGFFYFQYKRANDFILIEKNCFNRSALGDYLTFCFVLEKISEIEKSSLISKNL